MYRIDGRDYTDAARLIALCQENPFDPARPLAPRFEVILDGTCTTVGAFVSHRFKPERPPSTSKTGDLRWFIQHGYLRIEEPGKR